MLLFFFYAGAYLAYDRVGVLASEFVANAAT